MTDITQHVTSLELSKRLREVGVPQKALHTWSDNPSYGQRVLRASFDLFAGCDVDDTGRKYYSAWLASELGEMLKEPLIDNIFRQPHLLMIEKGDKFGAFFHYSGHVFEGKYFDDLMMSNALAKMLICLIENGYVKAGEL